MSARRTSRRAWSVALVGAAVVVAGHLSTAQPAPRAAAAPARASATGTPPSLTGIWQVMNRASWNIQDHHAEENVPAGLGVVVGNEIPYQPWALEQRKANYRERASRDPAASCYSPGVPRLTYMPYPFQIVQTPSEVLLIHEYARAIRAVHTNGSPHPKGPIDWWLGDSRGTWDNGTLVVDTVHFNDRTWFDHAGNFHSDQLHVVERFTPDGPDHIRYRVTIEDPKVFTRPWDMAMVLYRVKDDAAQLLEYECVGFKHERLYP